MKKVKQRGQSLVEFIVALIAVLPIFLGVYYIGKYADLQQSAIQASRYAAFQRVAQPDASKLTTAAIEDKIRARFFIQGQFLNNGELRSTDSVASVGATAGHNVLWRDLSNTPLLKDHKQVTLNFRQKNLSGLTATTLKTGSSPYDLDLAPIQVADVEVTVVNKLLFDQANPAAIKIGASTAAWGDTSHARGSQGVKNAIDNPAASFDSMIPGFLSTGLSAIIGLFENNSPDFGCHRVEFVPLDRLSTAGGGGGC